MKRRLLYLLCLILPLYLLIFCALAEGADESDEGAGTVPEIVEKLDYSPDALFVLNDELYAQDWRGVLKKVDSGWQRYNLTTNSNIMAVDITQDGAYFLERFYETYNATTGEWEMPESGMYAIGHLPLDDHGEPGEPVRLCSPDWELSDDYPQIDGMVVQDGAALLLLHDDNTDWDKLTLYRIDMATGKVTKALSDYISNIIRYKDGLLLARWSSYAEMYDDRGRLVRMPEIVSVNPSTGEVRTLASLPAASVGGLVYDAASDSVYCADSSFVYRYDNTFSTPEPVGYLLGSGSGSHSNGSATIYRDHYIIGDWSDENYVLAATIDPALLPTRTLRLSNVWNVDNLVREFAKAHPDVAIEYIDLAAETADEYKTHMQSSAAADIYGLSLPYQPYTTLRKHGLLADLSGSETLTALMDRMYPHLTGAYYANGALYGLPVYVYAYTLAYYPDALEKVGMTADDLPGTYGELLDFIVDWYYDYYDDYPEMQIFEWSPALRSTLINLIFNAQALSCEARNVPFTFDTPTIRSLLGRIDGQELDAIIEELSPKREQNGAEVIVYDYYEDSARALLTSSYDPTPSKYLRWDSAQPLLLRLDEETDPVIQTSVTLLVVNKAGAQQELAIELLEYIAEHLPQDVKTTLIPDENEPIEVEYYQQNLASFQESIAELEKALETSTDETERADYEEALTWYYQYLTRMEEEERWACTAEEITTYRADIAPWLVVSPRSIFTGEDNPAANLLQLYIDRARPADFFISQIDSMVNIMQNEQGF